MDTRFPHPRPKGSHHQFQNPRQQTRFGNQLYRSVNVASHLPSNNYDENYSQNPPLIVQTPDWQAQYNPPSDYTSPTCGSPVPSNIPPISTMYASPMPSTMYNASTQIQDGNLILNSSAYTPQVGNFEFYCAFCKTYNSYWKMFCDNKVSEKLKIISDKDEEIAELTAKVEKLEKELENEKKLLRTSEVLNNNIDEKKQVERTVTESQLSANAREYVPQVQKENEVPVVSANGDLNDSNYTTEETNSRIVNSVHTSDEHLSESAALTETRREECTYVSSPDVKSDPISSNNSGLYNISNNYLGELKDQVVSETRQFGEETLVERCTSEVKVLNLNTKSSSTVKMSDSSEENRSKQNPWKKSFIQNQNKSTQQPQITEIKQRKQSINVQPSLSRKNSDDGNTSNKNNRRDRGVRSPDVDKNLSTETTTSSRTEPHAEVQDDTNQPDSNKFGTKKKQTDYNSRRKRSGRGRYSGHDNTFEQNVNSHVEYPPLGAEQKKDESRQYYKQSDRQEQFLPKRSRSNSRSKHSESELGQSSYRRGNNKGYKGPEQDRYPRRRECLTEVTGDLFSVSENVSLAHCVGSDFRMGAGIAVTFKQRFKQVGELLQQNAKVGEVAYIKDGERYVFYMVTKKYSTGKPTYPDMKKTLEDLMAKCVQFEVRQLAIPRIGCGLDKLDWKQVKSMIKDVFEGVNIDITVYNFEDGFQEKDYKALQEKDKKGTLGKNKKSIPLRSGPLMQESFKPLVEIPSQTALIFLGTEDGYMDKTAESLERKYHFANIYKSEKKKVGEVLRIEKNNEVIYSLIVRQKADEPLNFMVLETCLKKLNKLLTSDEFSYVGLEAFNDPDDTMISKIISIFRSFLLSYLELWVCWPEGVVNFEKEHLKRQFNPYY